MASAGGELAGARRTGFAGWEVLPALLVAGAVSVIGARALTNAGHMDFGVYWHGAQLAWQTGSPWSERLWVGTPALALLLAPVTALRESQAAWLLTVLNILLALGLLGAAHLWLRVRTTPWFAWLVTLALAAWAPLAAGMWWKQLNLVALAAGVAGFMLCRRHPLLAGVLIGASIVVKPLLLVLPLYLLLSRVTRRAGVAAIVSAVGATVLGLVVLAAHGGTASPGAYLDHFDLRTGAAVPGSQACFPVNLSPAALACQAFGTDSYRWTRPLVIAVLVVVVCLVGLWIRRVPGGSLVVLAWAALLSPMLGPVQWSHYGITLAPMVLWVAASLFRRPRNALLWIGLLAGWALTELFWTPAMSLPAQVRVWLGGAPEEFGEAIDMIRVTAAAQVVLGIVGFLSGRDDPARTAETAETAETADDPELAAATSRAQPM